MEVTLIFRKRNPAFFSIEKVFGVINNELSATNKINTLELPFPSKGILQVCLNLIYLLKFKKGLFHITGDVHYVVLALPRNTTVLTIHDLVFLESHRGIKKYLLTWLYLKLPVSRAKYITTISEKSKEEITLNTNCDPDKIIVIPDPVDSTIKFEKKPFDERVQRFLFIGSKRNKNIERTIQAISGLKLHLRIIGNLNSSQKELLKLHGINHSNDHAISDEQLVQEYINCDAILFPSTYEGFGLPVIEAFAAGRPLITSNISPMKEISAGAAMLVDPYSVDSIREGIISVMTDAKLRTEMVAKGFEVITKYGSKKIASSYSELWHKVISDNASTRQ